MRTHQAYSCPRRPSLRTHNLVPRSRRDVSLRITQSILALPTANYSAMMIELVRLSQAVELHRPVWHPHSRRVFEASATSVSILVVAIHVSSARCLSGSERIIISRGTKVLVQIPFRAHVVLCAIQHRPTWPTPRSSAYPIGLSCCCFPGHQVRRRLRRAPK